jgi:hypothetical protein
VIQVSGNTIILSLPLVAMKGDIDTILKALYAGLADAS